MKAEASDGLGFLFVLLSFCRNAWFLCLRWRQSFETTETETESTRSWMPLTPRREEVVEKQPDQPITITVITVKKMDYNIPYIIYN